MGQVGAPHLLPRPHLWPKQRHFCGPEKGRTLAVTAAKNVLVQPLGSASVCTQKYKNTPPTVTQKFQERVLEEHPSLCTETVLMGRSRSLVYQDGEMDPSPAPTWGGREPTGVPGGFPRGDMQEYLKPKNTLERSVEQGGGAGVFYRTDCVFV